MYSKRRVNVRYSKVMVKPWVFRFGLLKEYFIFCYQLFKFKKKRGLGNFMTDVIGDVTTLGTPYLDMTRGWDWGFPNFTLSGGLVINSGLEFIGILEAVCSSAHRGLISCAEIGQHLHMVILLCLY